MADHDENERIARKAYEIWESEGRPHGRDQAHWDQAKEIVALHDSMGDTLLPREAGAFEPEEPKEAVENYGDVPGLADQGRDDLVDTDREPEFTKPGHEIHSLGDNAGHVARAPHRPSDGAEAEDADEEVVTPAPKVAAVTPTPSNPTLGVPAPRGAAATDPDLDRPQAVTPKTAEVPSKAAPGTGPGLGVAPVGNGAATSGTTPTPAASPSGTESPAGTASGAGPSKAEPSGGVPPIAAGAGAAPSPLDDARLGTAFQASPVGNSTQVTGKAAPKPAVSPTPVTKGRPGDRR